MNSNTCLLFRNIAYQLALFDYKFKARLLEAVEQVWDGCSHSTEATATIYRRSCKGNYPRTSGSDRH